MSKFFFFDKSLKNLVGKFVFLLLCVMIITHLVVFVVFASSNKREEYKVNRDLIVQQVVHLVQVISTTPSNQQEAVVEAIDVPNVDVEIDKKPTYKLRFSQVSMWEILEHISNERKQIQLSLELKDKQWLNVSALIVSTSWSLQIFLLCLELILAGAVIFYLWSINQFVVPIKRFAIAANRLGRDLHAPPLPDIGPPDVRHAAQAMNNMQDKLRSLIRERTQMLAAISHDLRTPITRLKLRAQFIQDDEIREKNIRDLDEMGAMITETLNFAREDSSHGKTVRLELGSLLSSLCDDLYEVYRNVDCEEIEMRIPVLGRPLALKRVFTNIIENAVKYGHAAHVKVALNHTEKQAMVIVDDEGVGIPESQLEKVFSPFYRSDRSRSRETGGTGLGLAVAQDIVRAHGGDIVLENLPAGGLRVSVCLPLED